MQIQNAYLTHNRPRTIRKQTTAIAVHWVGNPGSSAMANRNYFNNTDRSVSSNYIVGLQGEVICCIPDEEVSWCTNAANSYTVSIETCHPDWTGAFGSKTYASLVALTAQLCRKYGLNPQHGGVIRHYDVTGKVCPKWFVPKQKGGSDTADGAHWRQFLRDVANAKNADAQSVSSAPTPSASGAGYRVKVTADALHIRSGNGTSYPVVGCIRDKGVYTIVETKGDWGRLRSGAGWICLRYCRKV